MSKINGITYGTYPSIRPKKNVDRSVCENCNICKSKAYQLADSLERMHICKNSGCNLFYFSQTSKATVALGRDTITGKELKKTFVADTEEEALSLALEAKLNICKNGGPRIISKTNLSIIDIAKPLYMEDYKLHKINANTHSKNNTNIKISDDVVSVIAGVAVSEVPGVAQMSGGFAGGISEVLSGKKNLSKGIKVETGEKETKIDVNIIVEYGVRIPDVAFEIQNKVKKAVESMTGLKVVEVNVHIQGVSTENMGVENDKEEDKE